MWDRLCLDPEETSGEIRDRRQRAAITTAYGGAWGGPVVGSIVDAQGAPDIPGPGLSTSEAGGQVREAMSKGRMISEVEGLTVYHHSIVDRNSTNHIVAEDHPGGPPSYQWQHGGTL
jgi:hypothetical protein